MTAALTPQTFRPIVKTDAERILAGIAAHAPEVLLRPDAPVSGNGVVRTWAEVMDVVNAASGPVTVLVDCRSSGPYTIPAGVYEMRNGWLRAVTLGNADENVLIAPEGVRLRNLAGLVSAVALRMAPTSVAPLEFDSLSPAQPPVFGLLFGAKLKSEGSRALVDAAALMGAPALIFGLSFGGSVDDTSTQPIIALAPSAMAIVAGLEPGGSPANIVSGDGSTILQIIGSTALIVPPTVGFTGTVQWGPGPQSWGGPSALRPGFAPGIMVGWPMFDTTIGKPIWWSGTAWVLADGTLAP